MAWNNQQTATASATGVDVGLRSYMNRVYTLMSLGIGLTGIVTYIIASIPELLNVAMSLKWVFFIGVLGLGWFAPQIIMTKSRTSAGIAFWVYSTLWGAMIAPMVAYFLYTIPDGPHLIAQAFFITSIMFAGSSMYGYVTKRDLSAFGRFIMMALIGLIVAMIANIFIGSSMMSLGISALVVLLSAGITAYETQMIRNMYYQLPSGQAVSRFAILGAFMLYGTFVQMFIHILNILAHLRR